MSVAGVRTTARVHGRTYGRLFVAGFRRQSTYRLAALGGLLANNVFGLLKVALLFAAVRASGGELRGYDVGSISAYIWLSQGLLGSVNLFGRSDVADRIKTGDVAVDLLRPVDVQAAAITSEVGRSVFALIPRGLPTVLIGTVFVGLSMPVTPAPYFLGAVSILLGITISQAVVYLVGVSGFWLIETRGLQLFYMVLSGFFAGLFVPIQLFPAWLLALATATPFPSMLMYPVDVVSGRVAGLAALGLVAVQLAWLAVVATVGALMTRAGQHRLEVQGWLVVIARGADAHLARTAPYRAVLASRIRSQRSYRASFRLDVASSLTVGLVELAEVWVVFHSVSRLGGLDLAQIALVFGLADVSYCFADLAFGHCDTLPTYLRAGTLDVFYLRPQPLLLQLVTSDVALRRLGRVTVGAAALVVGLSVNDVPWSLAAVALLVVAFLSGLTTFAAMFVWAAGAQFFLVDGAEATNAFVYGGRYAATQPGSVWGRPLFAVFGFFFPMAFTAYLPVITLLGLPAPHGLPDWAGWLAPVAAAWTWALALVAWRIGVRHYQGGGGMSRPTDEAIVRAEGLGRDFSVRDGLRRRTVTAVADLTVTIDAGEAVGYIGANGAGKSTTIKMVTGILVPTRGRVTTCGLQPVRDRRRLAREVGVVFGQRTQLWWDLPVRESLRILAAIHALSPAAERARQDELIERLELSEFLSTPVRQLSLGQRMRAEVAAALQHSPRLVILDEPTIGLDVLSKQRLREFLIAERRTHGTTLVLTTHDMGDVERLCDRVLLVDRGSLVYDGTLAGLSRTVGAERVLVVDLAEPTPDLVGLADTRHLASEGGGLRQRLSFDPETTTAARVLADVSERAEVLDLSVEEPDVEDVVRRVYASRR